jgi:hypothetical protein
VLEWRSRYRNVFEDLIVEGTRQGTMLVANARIAALALIEVAERQTSRPVRRQHIYSFVLFVSRARRRAVRIGPKAQVGVGDRPIYRLRSGIWCQTSRAGSMTRVETCPSESPPLVNTAKSIRWLEGLIVALVDGASGVDPGRRRADDHHHRGGDEHHD